MPYLLGVPISCSIPIGSYKKVIKVGLKNGPTTMKGVDV
jgi:hypothetical protein